MQDLITGSDFKVQKMTKNNNCYLKKIVVSKIHVDPTYMQGISKKHVKRIVENWDDRLMNTPRVSKRNDKYYVFDGQHTIEAIKEKFGKEAVVTCLIYNLASPKDEYLMRMRDAKLE